MRARVVGPLAAVLVVLASCSGDPAGTARTEPATDDPATTQPASTEPATTEPATTEPATTAPVTTEATTTTSTTTTTTVPATTTTSVPETTTTTTPPPPPAPVPGQPNPACITVVAPGDSLGAIVARLNNPALTVDAIALENGLANPNAIDAGAQLDICPGNAIDDITGGPWVPPTVPPPATAPAPTPPPPVQGLASGVSAQQQKLNELFGPLGMRTLAVDGDSGRQTKQLLCAARVALGLPVSRDDMVPGSPEEQSLMAATGLQIPTGAPVSADRWALIDQHCQVMFVGQGANELVFVFPTSTGQAEFPTRDQDAARVFRYDPARPTAGWHNSIDYPVGDDNPLNGNMYKPLYFDRGQAIHGANTVPTSPASHGCARLRVGDQDALISWLGLADQDNQIWDGIRKINFTVSVVGRY